jgi:hypothetical protein
MKRGKRSAKQLVQSQARRCCDMFLDVGTKCGRFRATLLPRPTRPPAAPSAYINAYINAYLSAC